MSADKSLISRSAQGNKHFDGSLLMVCSLSGRIIHATDLLKAEFGTEISGKNLNDFLDDGTVSEIISRAVKGEAYFFNCLIGGRLYSGTSNKEGNALNVSFALNEDEDSLSVGENSLRYLQAEINSVLATLLGALSTFEDSNDPTAMFARRNIYRLLRVTWNVFDRAACESGDDSYIKQNCDILEICRDVAERLRFPLRSVNVEIEVWHDGGRHICYCVVEQIERMISNMISCALKGMVNNGKPVYLKLDVIEKEDDVLISILSPHRVMAENMIAGVFSGHDKKAPLPDREMKQTLLTIKSIAAYNSGSLVMSTEKDGDRLAVLLPKVKGYDSLKLKAPKISYNSGTDASLVELSEILPDSLY